MISKDFFEQLIFAIDLLIFTKHYHVEKSLWISTVIPQPINDVKLGIKSQAANFCSFKWPIL